MWILLASFAEEIYLGVVLLNIYTIYICIKCCWNIGIVISTDLNDIYIWIFLNISSLELELELECRVSPCQGNRIFVNFCWDGFVYLRRCFFPLICVIQKL